jgi:hypothetical protein
MGPPGPNWYVEAPPETAVPATKPAVDPFADYVFLMNPDQLSIFLAEVDCLRFGEDLQTVLHMLGEPYQAYRADAKELLPDLHGHTVLNYLIARHPKYPDLVLQVDFGFDSFGRLESVVPHPLHKYPPIRSRETTHISDGLGIAPNLISLIFSGDPLPSSVYLDSLRKDKRQP